MRREWEWHGRACRAEASNSPATVACGGKLAAAGVPHSATAGDSWFRSVRRRVPRRRPCRWLSPPWYSGEQLRDERINASSLDDLNRNSPLKPAFFDYDSSELSAETQRAPTDNAAQMKSNPVWSVTIEGHCGMREARLSTIWRWRAPGGGRARFT